MSLVVKDSPTSRVQAAHIVIDGGLIAFRTDTFYGLGVDPLNRNALQEVRTLKGREENKPILIVISDAVEADRFIEERSSLFEIASARHWTGCV